MGGALLMAKAELQLKWVPLPPEYDVQRAAFELVCATVYNGSQFLFLCCVFYIPPGAADREYMAMFHILEQICIKYEKVILVGDLNLYSASHDIQCYYAYFLSFCEFLQCNEVGNQNNRMLDVVLTTFSNAEVQVSEERDPLVGIDKHHPPLSVCITCVRPHRPPAGPTYQASVPYPKWNFNKADFYKLYTSLAEADWSSLYETNTVAKAIEVFYTIFNSIIDDCVPRKKKSTNKLRYQYPKWYTPDLICTIVEKAKWHKIYKCSNSDHDYDVFAQYRALVKILISEAYDQNRRRVESQFIEDPRSFWGYMANKRANLTGQSISKDGRILPTENGAREFAEYFHSVYLKKPPQLDVLKADRAAQISAASVNVSSLQIKEVTMALARLKPKRSVGPDGIPPFLVKDCRLVLAQPLHFLFNLCLKDSIYPEEWKLTKVTPIKKTATGSNIDEHRPVAVLSTFAKVFESALHSRIYSQVNARLADEQHGFRPGRSVDTNLLSFITYATKALDSRVGGQIDVAYFDFRKAFDTVDNDILLQKLSSCGFTPSLLKFFTSYLSNRKQYVEYAAYASADGKGGITTEVGAITTRI
ncbi:hypothetical protein O0L34_g19366 [Tuta absoluta]|nr:hypothetical protein O0L34_g19366 [Tuta absoluta]